MYYTNIYKRRVKRKKIMKTKRNIAKTLAAVHTHTHTHTCSLRGDFGCDKIDVETHVLYVQGRA